MVVAASLAMSANAQIVTLTDDNSIVRINAGSQAGVYQWQVDGTSALNQQWFWYRIGQNAEQPINAIGAPVITPASPYSAKLVYAAANGSFDVQVTYTLQGGALGTGASDLSEMIKINNYSAAPLDFHFFQYSDFNLGAADSVALSQNLSGKFFRSTQTFGAAELQETVVSPGANRGEVAATPFTLGRLNDGVATDLNNNVNAAGDVSWAFQWDFTIAANSSAQIGKDKSLQVTPVPEPTTAALAGLGLALLMATVRRRMT